MKRTHALTLTVIILIILCGIYGFHVRNVSGAAAEGFSAAAESLSQRHDAAQPTLSPEVAAYTLLTTVMKPIRRLGSTLTDMNVWKDRIAMSRMSPVELARKQLQGNQ